MDDGFMGLLVMILWILPHGSNGIGFGLKIQLLIRIPMIIRPIRPIGARRLRAHVRLAEPRHLQSWGEEYDVLFNIKCHLFTAPIYTFGNK